MNGIDFSQLPLRDIHLPESVSWWPPAPGWWALLGILLLLAAVAIVRYRRRHRERAALRGLKSVAEALGDGAAPVVCIQRISTILRRFAMSVADYRAVAGLTGDAWLKFLDSRWGRDEFAEGIGRILTYGPYVPADRVSRSDVAALNGLCLDWVRAQRAPEA